MTASGKTRSEEDKLPLRTAFTERTYDEIDLHGFRGGGREALTVVAIGEQVASTVPRGDSRSSGARLAREESRVEATTPTRDSRP